MMHAIADTIAHARILRHQGPSGIGGAADIELQGDDLRSVRDTVLQRIAEAAGKTYDRIFDDSLRDRWFTAEEAIEYGLHRSRHRLPVRPASSDRNEDD